MKIPYFYNCDECGLKRTHWANINDPYVKHKCRCGYESKVLITSTITIGFKILYRANFELIKRKDYSLSIILSVMAFEAEQLRIYKKWHILDSKSFIDPSVVDEEIRKLFRRFNNAKKKINETSKKLTGSPFNEYIRNDTNFLKSMRKAYPELEGDNSLECFHNIMCDARNDIMHGAGYSYSKEKAGEVYSIARDGIHLLQVMDKEKRRTMSP